MQENKKETKKITEDFDAPDKKSIRDDISTAGAISGRPEYAGRVFREI